MNQSKAGTLIPVIAKHILFRNYDSNDEVAVIDRNSGAIIGLITQDELQIVSHCTGREDLHTIFQQVKCMPVQDGICFIRELYLEKIIKFKDR